MTPSEFEQVERVYVLDGPGLCSDVFEPTLLDGVLDKVQAILPVSSMVGRLFEPNYVHKKIVQSAGRGIEQHGLFNWQVSTTGLVSADKHDSTSDWLEENLSKWLGDIPIPERRDFINDLFDRIAINQSESFLDIADQGLQGIEEILISLFETQGQTKQHSFSFMFRAFWGDLFHLRFETLWERKYSLPLMLFVLGVLLCLF